MAHPWNVLEREPGVKPGPPGAEQPSSRTLLSCWGSRPQPPEPRDPKLCRSCTVSEAGRAALCDGNVPGLVATSAFCPLGPCPRSLVGAHVHRRPGKTLPRAGSPRRGRVLAGPVPAPSAGCPMTGAPVEHLGLLGTSRGATRVGLRGQVGVGRVSLGSLPECVGDGLRVGSGMLVRAARGWAQGQSVVGLCPLGQVKVDESDAACDKHADFQPAGLEITAV